MLIPKNIVKNDAKVVKPKCKTAGGGGGSSHHAQVRAAVRATKALGRGKASTRPKHRSHRPKHKAHHRPKPKHAAKKHTKCG